MHESVVDVTERLMHRYDRRLRPDLVGEVVASVLAEQGDPGAIGASSLERMADARLERLARARLPQQPRGE